LDPATYLHPGTRLGPYEIVALLGAGGMGVVYRARDTRLGREVAVKVLPSALADDAERLHRFELEAQAAGRLNHPNLLAIHDVGTHDGAPYLVSELLEGQSLRERLSASAVPARRVIEYGVQVAHGLAAAHDKGIVHRDLKPENLFLTRDGRIKILDFGLAKLLPPPPGAAVARDAPTVTVDTDPGKILGTVNYMSPEQVRGQAVDHRSDIFSLGVILHEMLTGARAFQRDSAVETMHAILRDEPPDLTAIHPPVPSGLERMVRHCLEKTPEARFQSARDLAFDLEALSLSSGSAIPLDRVGTAQRWAVIALALAIGLPVLVAGAFWAGRRSAAGPDGRNSGRSVGLGDASAPPRLPAHYTPLTFRRGTVLAARFGRDEHTIYYSAAWDHLPIRIYETTPGTTERRSQTRGHMLALAPDGEMIISSDWEWRGDYMSNGRAQRLRLPLGSELPRDLLDDRVYAADIVQFRDGSKRTVLVRQVQGMSRLELHDSGEVLYENAGGWIGNPRFSADGDKIAFVDHVRATDDAGDIVVIDLKRKKRVLSAGWKCAQGLAWNGNEVWFTADRESGMRLMLNAVTLDDPPREREIERGPGRIRLLDISRTGRVLLTREQIPSRVLARTKDMPPGEEVDLSYLDGSFATDLSRDGHTLVTYEQGGAPGANEPAYTARVRAVAEDSPLEVLPGEAYWPALSSDEKELVCSSDANHSLLLHRRSGGKPTKLRRGAIAEYAAARWIPNRRAIVFAGAESTKSLRLYQQELPDGDPRSMGAEVSDGLNFAVSPDGSRVAAISADERIFILPLAGGDPATASGALPGELPVRWADDHSLYVRPRGAPPMSIVLVDLPTGKREARLQIKAHDAAGLIDIASVVLTADAKSYAYTFFSNFYELYLVDQLK
jgi:hypothetical protein